ncbi:ABC transporter ATP-binding protein [Arthrobacter agilis]|uniref:ABC transporter ATP-binding protein n=1 Tax=Arthrobacter agilis TaxID=37921 RepID=UPI002367207C|nr:ABC transporter ATP-binding protein [Arthrobacter agilis]WDF34755.1 ABC transporter ATP-binding protein [Arthrobacter agilis]
MSPTAPALEIDGLIKDFGPVGALDGRMVRVLDGVGLQASHGAVTVLLGANGAGKTTTLECAQGLQRADGGTVRLLGEDPSRASPQLRARVGVMLQDGGLPPSVRPLALLRHVASMYSSPLPVGALAERLGIDDFGAVSIRRLSGGQKQRLALACALVGRPEVVFLDEPSAGLDPQSRTIVFDLIRELRADGLAVILTTHLLDDAQRLADYVYIIEGGRTVAEGTVAELTAETDADGVRELRFETLPGLTLPPDLLPHLHQLEAEPGHYVLRGVLTANDVARLATWWTDCGVMPSTIALAPRSLEDVFLDISGRSIR